MDLLLDIDPELYGPFVTTDKKGEKLIIVQFINNICGTMVASLLYYNKFVNTPKSTGFQLNPYDPFVANHLVNDKQNTIFLHVYDCNIVHQDRKLNEKFINTLRDKYKSVFEDGSVKMKVSQGKVHKYLGMNLVYSVKGRVKTTIMDYIN